MFAQIAVRLTTALGDGLLGLYAHGSWVSGDFAPLRSDLDMLAVLSRQPDELLLSLLDDTHARLAAHHPQWAGRIEVEYVALSTIEAFAADPSNPGEHVIARISPGEQMHLLPATSHRLLTWASVQEGGHPLYGPTPSTLLPPVRVDVVTAAVMDHVRDWPEWVRDMRSPGGQAYAVLTVCRALHLVREGTQVSKRQAAEYAVTEVPEWAELIRWAQDWWYAEGSDAEDSDTPRRFASWRTSLRPSSATPRRARHSVASARHVIASRQRVTAQRHTEYAPERTIRMTLCARLSRRDPACQGELRPAVQSKST